MSRDGAVVQDIELSADLFQNCYDHWLAMVKEFSFNLR